MRPVGVLTRLLTLWLWWLFIFLLKVWNSLKAVFRQTQRSCHFCRRSGGVRAEWGRRLPGSDHLWPLLFSLCSGSSWRTGGTRQTTAATAPAPETLQRRSTMWVFHTRSGEMTVSSGLSERRSVSPKAFGFRSGRKPYYLTSRWLRYNVGC